MPLFAPKQNHPSAKPIYNYNSTHYEWWSRQESNLHPRLRRPVLYPLSYETVDCLQQSDGWVRDEHFRGCSRGYTRNSHGLLMQPKSRRIVVKFGSGILAHPSGFGLDEAQFEQLTYAVSGLRSAGHEVIVVSSGAVAAGGMAFGLVRRPEDTATLQAIAAVGQTRLMQRYESLFSRHGLLVAQLLLTNEDLQQPSRRENLTNTLERLLSFKNVIPIINENDSVAIDELKVGDNDRLSAGVACLAGADVLILLTSVDGLLDAAGCLIPKVADLAAVESHIRPEKGVHSTGGMASKLGSAAVAMASGVEVVIANGRNPAQLLDLAEGGGVGTRLRPTQASAEGLAVAP